MDYVIEELKNLPEDIPAVVSDDRRLSEGCLFICCPITNYNGAASIPKAIRAGAAVIVTERGLYEEALGASGMTEKEFLGDRPPRIHFVDDARYAMAFIYAAWYGHPAEKMTTIGITGTKGKTTVAHMIYEILTEAGYKTGLIGTMETIIDGKHTDTIITTPEADVLQELLFRMAEAGTEIVVMEVSSQALMTHRSQGFIFDIGVFTNIGVDHIGPEECRDFEHYISCKGRLMRQCRTGIINIDDPHAGDLLEGHTCEVKTYGIASGQAGLLAANISCLFVDRVPGVEFDAEESDEEGTSLRSGSLHIRMPMPGMYSVSNALAAICTAKQLSVSDAAIVNALERIYVNGRMNVVRPEQPEDRSFPAAIVDFAHNGISVRELLKTLRIYYSGKIIIVIGSLGASVRRAPIGEACGEFADLTVISVLDWKTEDHEEIIRGIESGVLKKSGEYVIIPDRRQAIQYAISVAGPDDLVVAAGRGSINNKRIGDRIIPVPDDRELLLEAFRSCGR